MATDTRRTEAHRRVPLWRWRPFQIIIVAVVLAALGLVFAAEYVLRNAGPLLRKRIVATLSNRFDAPVELDTLDISLFRGVEVNGNGLRIGYGAGSLPVVPGDPMIAVAHFAFRTGLRSLIGDTLAHRPLHIGSARVDGLDLHIPPPRDRSELERAKRPHAPEKYEVVVNQLQCRDVKLFLESAKPGSDNGHKPPLEFDISTLTLENAGKHQAMRYDAQLINAKPVGAIHAGGHFGPWANETTDDGTAGDPDHQPGDTPIDGDYTFDHADLSTVKGIGGTLSSTGRFAGTLDRITVDGHTDTPNFSLEIADHTLPLHTDFHAIVDGTTGDTYLDPVHALLGNSAFTTTGKIVKIKGQGHDIQLQVDIPHGRMADFLRLAIKTSPPLLNGTLSMKANLHIPPGHAPVPAKMSMAGTFNITGVQFSNPKWQDRIDGLSARAQGQPGKARTFENDRRTEFRSQLSADFTLSHGVMGVTDMHYGVPGAIVLMNGVYSMDGKLFEFKGHVRTEATASQMVGGWKGFLLRPLDHFLAKNGAGLELPIEISGTEGDMHFGLSTHDAGDTPTQLLADIKQKQHSKQQLNAARGESAEADAEDQAAAQAPTLAQAQRHHNNAVRLRAEAQGQATQAGIH